MDNDNENKSMSSYSNPADSPSMATVIIASPVVENYKLAIAVQNSLKQYQPVGEFESIFEISQDLHIFKGTLPSTDEYNSKFKFVYVNSEDQDKIEHESKTMIRKQESKTNSWIFGFFELSSKISYKLTDLSILPLNKNGKFKKSVKELNETKIRKQIASEFFGILFKQICDEVLSEKEWDGAFKSWDEGLQEIKDVVDPQDSLDGFRDFLNTWIDDWTPNPKINFDQLFLLVVGAYFMKVNFEKMRNIFVSNTEEFSLYLHKSMQCHLSLKNQDLSAILNNIAERGGRKFFWIFFRINEHSRFQNNEYHDVSQSILETLKDIPEVLLDNQECASRVVDYLVRSNDINELYENLRPTFVKDAKYQQLLDPYLLKHFLIHRKTVEDLIKIICSNFMKNTYEMVVRQEASFDETITTIFDHKKLTDLIQLAVHTPDYLLPVVNPVIESNVSQELEKMATFSSEEYEFFLLQEKNEKFNHFQYAKKKIEDRLLKMATDYVEIGSFQEVKSVKLILFALTKRNIPFHDCETVSDIKKAMDKEPEFFFQNLYSVLNNLNVPLETLKQYRKGDTRQMVIDVERHFDMLKKLKENIQERKVPLIEFPILRDSRVLDLLKTLGLTKLEENQLFQEFDVLKERQELYGHLLLKCSYSAAVYNQGDQNSSNSEIIQILDSKEWEKYLKEIDSENSILTLKDAMELRLPLQLISAQWLSDVMESALFKVKIWFPSTTSLQNYPLCNENLQAFVNECCATQWKELARKVADGTASFKEMDEIISLEPNPDFLSRKHLQSPPIDDVLTAYQNFKNLQELRHVIGPFVAALQLFSIKDRKMIVNLHEFVENNLLLDWDSTTLRQTTENGILKVMNEDLKINSERPETQNTIQFISSLVTTDGNGSLIKWLREKEEKDMEAMGKVLQGNLLEAYGQLQTLRTKTAPFLLKVFNTLHDLLREVRNSEERFAQCSIFGRLQTIECKWLINMLPAIEAAVRASIISPSEDAKEKLGKLRQVVIEPKNTSYSIQIQLEPNGSLSMEELKQAFQLLDMTLMDHDRYDSDNFICRTRQNVVKIEQLSEVFELLFASGCISYTFHEKIVIELGDLDTVLGRLREQLEEWNNQWKEMDQMPLLALFSRSYLLQLVDLIGRNQTETSSVFDVMSIFQILLPSAASKMGESINKLVQQAPRIGTEETWLSTAQLFKILRELHKLIEDVSHERIIDFVNKDVFLVDYGQTLTSYFNSNTTVAILNVPREFLVGSALAAYASLTQQPIEPSRILFVTTNTDKQEIERFMKLWSVAKFIDKDIFIIVHVERLTAACASAVREGVDRVLPERRAKLLLLAQHQHRIQSTKSLGARLGLVSDRLLNINFTANQLRECLSTRLPKSNQLYFYTSKLPGCGKSQRVMRKASELNPTPGYYRVCIRTGTVKELMTSLKSIKIADQSGKRDVFLHLDVAHSVSVEFNDILLSLLMNGALYDPQNAKLGYWIMSPQTSIAVEFASPFGTDEFPIIAYLGQHHICKCEKSFFTYQLAEMPRIIGQPIKVNLSDALIVAGKFLQLKQAGQEGLCTWDDLCSQPENITNNPLSEEDTFNLLVDSFQHCDDKGMLVENRNDPTFTALNAMASFLHQHICVMIRSMWFNNSVKLFTTEYLALVFKQNIFNVLLKVANVCITRCWSVVNHGKKLPNMDWTNRQRAILLIGRSDMDVTGVNIVGCDAEALKAMFDRNLLNNLQLQGLQFQELHGFQNLVKNQQDAEEVAQQVILNATRSLFLLDGTTSSIEKVKQLDNHDRNTPAITRLHGFIAQDQGYVLTGDNITKMMFALYRIRCGLPVIVFGETGVGKTALFRFLIQTFLGHTFKVCNVNSGTTIQDVEEMVQSGVKTIKENPKAEVFLLLDELNTADAPVIAYIKELMLDRHCHGSVLPENLHLIGTANPYRLLKKTDKEAAVGLSFCFAQSTQNRAQTDGRNLVYRVNELSLAFYDHIYDFGHLCEEAEDIYIDEICQKGLSKTIFFDCNVIKWFTDIIKRSHRVARESSVEPESAVSLRDVARAVQLFKWFYQSPASKMLSGGNVEKAADLTIYLVYAFRFRERETFLKEVFGKDQSASKNMKDVSRSIAKMLYDKAHGASIGSGAIALNDALCENLFALYVCVLNGIFLIIVARPGSSKSLSVEILKLVLSPGNYELRKELGDLPALTELYFQCSPMSTSSGFKALFESAQKLSDDPKTMLATL